MTAAARRGGGIGLVGVALVVSGLLVNGYLAVVARYLSPADYAHFGAVWSLSLLVGFGVYLPVEQVLARELPAAARPRRLLRGAVRPTATLLALELAVTVAASPLLWVATGRDPAVLVVVAALCVVSAGQFLLRGWLVGTGATGRYALVLLVDSALRVGLAVVVGSSLPPGVAAFAWVVVVAVGVAHLPLLLVVLRRPEPAAAADVAAPDAPAPVAGAVRTTTLLGLVAGSLAGQLLLNAIPVVVAGLASTAEEDGVGRFQAAFQLARIPLFIATPLQAVLVPSLAVAVATGGHAAAVRLVRRLLLALGGLVAVGAAIGFALGPLLVRLVFGDRYPVTRLDVGLLAVGSACYLVTLVVTQLLVVQHRIRRVVATWAAGVVAAGGVFLVERDLLVAAVWSFVAGSVVAVVVGLVGAAARGPVGAQTPAE